MRSVQPSMHPVSVMTIGTTSLGWISGVVGAITATASVGRMFKSKDRIKTPKQMSRRKPSAVAIPSLYGAWLTDTVTYHH